MPLKLARPTGIEPVTVGLEGRCSILLSYGRRFSNKQDSRTAYLIGRGREIRTPDILLPKQARYQTALYPDFYKPLPGAETAAHPSPGNDTCYSHEGQSAASPKASRMRQGHSRTGLAY